MCKTLSDWCIMLLQVAVLYASDYGYSDRLSQTIARGITKANVAVEMLDLLSADPQVYALHHQPCDSNAIAMQSIINIRLVTAPVHNICMAYS